MHWYTHSSGIFCTTGFEKRQKRDPLSCSTAEHSSDSSLSLSASFNRAYTFSPSHSTAVLQSSVAAAKPRSRRLYTHVQVTKSSVHVGPVASVKNPHCRLRHLSLSIYPVASWVSSCRCSSSSSSLSSTSTSRTTASKACRSLPHHLLLCLSSCIHRCLCR
jgi:hypothetical protein